MGSPWFALNLSKNLRKLSSRRLCSVHLFAVRFFEIGQ